MDAIPLFRFIMKRFMYTDKEMYLLSVTSMEVERLLIIDNKVINTKNVAYTEIIKESVMNIDKYY